MATEDNKEDSTTEDRKVISRCILSKRESAIPKSNINKASYNINRVASQRQEIRMGILLSLCFPKPRGTIQPRIIR